MFKNVNIMMVCELSQQSVWTLIRDIGMMPVEPFFIPWI